MSFEIPRGRRQRSRWPWAFAITHIPSLVCVFFLFPLLGSFARAQQPEPTAAEGIQLYQQGDLSGATRILLEVVKQHPDDAEAQYAARKIKFTPATKDVREVSQYIQLEYNFNLY